MKPHWHLIAVIALGALSVVLATALGGLLLLSPVRQKTPPPAASPDRTVENQQRLLKSIKRFPIYDKELKDAADAAGHHAHQLRATLPPEELELYDDAWTAMMWLSLDESKGDPNDLMRAWIRHFQGKSAQQIIAAYRSLDPSTLEKMAPVLEATRKSRKEDRQHWSDALPILK